MKASVSRWVHLSLLLLGSLFAGISFDLEASYWFLPKPIGISLSQGELLAVLIILILAFEDRARGISRIIGLCFALAGIVATNLFQVLLGMSLWRALGKEDDRDWVGSFLFGFSILLFFLEVFHHWTPWSRSIELFLYVTVVNCVGHKVISREVNWVHKWLIIFPLCLYSFRFANEGQMGGLMAIFLIAMSLVNMSIILWETMILKKSRGLADIGVSVTLALYPLFLFSNHKLMLIQSVTFTLFLTLIDELIADSKLSWKTSARQIIKFSLLGLPLGPSSYYLFAALEETAVRLSLPYLIFLIYSVLFGVVAGIYYRQMLVGQFKEDKKNSYHLFGFVGATLVILSALLQAEIYQIIWGQHLNYLNLAIHIGTWLLVTIGVGWVPVGLKEDVRPWRYHLRYSEVFEEVFGGCGTFFKNVLLTLSGISTRVFTCVFEDVRNLVSFAVINKDDNTRGSLIAFVIFMTGLLAVSLKSTVGL